MFTNDLKKGDIVTLRNGWKAEMMDNLKGDTRLAKVFGDYTEIGSVYAHDIIYVHKDNMRIQIEHTDKQKKLFKKVHNIFSDYDGDFML